MDIKPTTSQLPTLYQRPAPLAGEKALNVPSVRSEDVVDCVEIRAGRFSPANDTAIRYVSFAAPGEKKGTLIDLFI